MPALNLKTIEETTLNGDADLITRVLVVDDEESVRSLVSLVLEEDGYEVTTAASGEEALELFKQNAFPVVVSDIRMGEMDGLTLLKNIHEVDSDTQVIIITSHVSDHSAVQALKNGAFDYVVKPFDDLDDITDVVNRAKEKSATQGVLTRRQKELAEKTAKIIEQNNATIKKSEDITSLNKNTIESVNEDHVTVKKDESIAALNKRIRDSVNKDNLTGLPSKTSFNEMIAEEISRASSQGGSAVLMLVRVNGLQQYTERYGEDKANTIIIGVSKLVTFRHSDSAARYDEDTFSVLIRDLKIESANIYAQKVCERIASIKKLNQINISINVGIAGYPDDEFDTEKLTLSAKNALADAEMLGPNRSVHPCVENELSQETRHQEEDTSFSDDETKQADARVDIEIEEITIEKTSLMKKLFSLFQPK